MSTPVTTYDKRPVIVSPTAPTSLEQLRYLWLDISETTPVLRYYNSTGIWEAINAVDTSSFLTTNGVQTITGAKTFNTGTITVADITVDDVTIEGIDTIKLTDDDTHVPTSKLVEDTIVSAISGLETSIDGELATKADDNEVVKLTGDQIVQGVKEFGNDIYFNGSILFGTSSSTMSSFNNVDQDFVSPSTTTVPSTQAVANALSEKQNTLKYYSEGDNTVTIETPIYPNTNVSIKAGATGLEMGHGSSGTSTTVKLGVFSADTVTQGLTVGGGDVNITTSRFRINNSTPDVTTIVDSINLQSGGENALPTASAVRVAVNQIKTDLGSALTYKGSVDTYDQLPEDAEVGDTWNVAQAYQTYPAGTNYAWTGSAWDALGGSVDLSGYQTKSDDTLATSAKTVVGAINELSTDKQNTLKYYSESNSPSSGPRVNHVQVSILGTSEYEETLNLGSDSNNGIQTINIGGNAVNTRNINIGTQASGGDNNVTIGNASDGVLLTLNTGRGLAGTGVTKDLSTSATDAQFPTAAAVNNQLILKQNITDNTLTTADKTIVGAINEIENKVLDSHLSKLPYGTLYFDKGKLSGSNFAVPTFPFSICATVRIDAWQSDSFAQTIFQCGDYESTTDPWMTLSFANNSDYPRIRLLIALMIDGALKTTEVNCSLDLSTFLGKMHTIIGICRAVTTEVLNWDIYIDGAKQNITSSLKNVVVSSLSGTRKWAVNTSNYNFSSQTASANPMMLRNLYIFNFDVSAEDAPYSIADYEAGRLIPPELKPSQVSLALENYTIARNATTTLVKDTSGNSNDATVKGNVAGDNDQSIKVFVDEIKTQINQSNG